MASDYDTKMYGQVTINWSVGADEDGVVSGYIGVPRAGGEELLDNIGTTLAFQEPITGYSDEKILMGVQITMTQTLKHEVLPLIIPQMVAACQEMRERYGGFQPAEG